MYCSKGGRKDETCVQCLIKRPGVASWGCTLSEMREWCQLAFEESPADMLEEEEQLGDFIKPDNFRDKHKDEVTKFQAQLSKGIQTFATMLSKFDKAHPEFTKEEAKIMDEMITNHKTPIEALKIVKPSRSFRESQMALRKKLVASKEFKSEVQVSDAFKKYETNLKKGLHSHSG